MKTFEQLHRELLNKLANEDPESASVAHIRSGVHEVGKKVVEEAAEAWMAAEHEGSDRAAEEIAQLLYQTQALMLAAGIDLGDVYKHL